MSTSFHNNVIMRTTSVASLGVKRAHVGAPRYFQPMTSEKVQHAWRRDASDTPIMAGSKVGDTTPNTVARPD